MPTVTAPLTSGAPGSSGSEAGPGDLETRGKYNSDIISIKIEKNEAHAERGTALVVTSDMGKKIVSVIGHSFLLP